MGTDHGDDAENDAPRSYCMFERDRDLPRPASWRPPMTEAAAPNRFARVVAAGWIGVALVSAVTVWWFVGRAG